MIIQPDIDPLGQAILDFQTKGAASNVVVSSDIAEDDVIVPKYLFRKYTKMPKLEKVALKQCKGRILDIGAGAGPHALYLHKQGFDVDALESSTLACEAMKNRSVPSVINEDIFDYSTTIKYDTILLLMNGVGIAGDLEGLKKLLLHIKSLMTDDGQILLDSSDLIYLFEDEEGGYWVDINSDKYYGQIEYTMQYGEVKGESFQWLFVDQTTLDTIAESCGLKSVVIEYGSHFDFLVKLTKL